MLEFRALRFWYGLESTSGKFCCDIWNSKENSESTFLWEALEFSWSVLVELVVKLTGWSLVIVSLTLFVSFPLEVNRVLKKPFLLGLRFHLVFGSHDKLNKYSNYRKISIKKIVLKTHQANSNSTRRKNDLGIDACRLLHVSSPPSIPGKETWPQLLFRTKSIRRCFFCWPKKNKF